MNHNEIYDLALDEYQKNNYEQSIKLLNQMLEDDSTHSHSWHLLGNIFFNLDDLNRAKDFFLAAVNVKNDFFDSYNTPIKNIGKAFTDFYTAVALKSLDILNTLDFRWTHKNSQSLWYESVTVFSKEEIPLICESLDLLLKEKNHAV